MQHNTAQSTPVARTTKLRINKDIIQRTFGLRVRFMSDCNKSHKTINKCFMFLRTWLSSYIWSIFHAVTLVGFYLSFSEFFSFHWSLLFFLFFFFCLCLVPSFRPRSVSACFFLPSIEAGRTPAWYLEDAQFAVVIEVCSWLSRLLRVVAAEVVPQRRRATPSIEWHSCV